MHRHGGEVISIVANDISHKNVGSNLANHTALNAGPIRTGLCQGSWPTVLGLLKEPIGRCPCKDLVQTTDHEQRGVGFA